MAMPVRSPWPPIARRARVPRSRPASRSVSPSRDDSRAFFIRGVPVPGGPVPRDLDHLAEPSGFRGCRAVGAHEGAPPGAHDLAQRGLAEEIDQTLGEPQNVLLEVELAP